MTSGFHPEVGLAFCGSLESLAMESMEKNKRRRRFLGVY
jgi:hypothetical protein